MKAVDSGEVCVLSVYSCHFRKQALVGYWWATGATGWNAARELSQVSALISADNTRSLETLANRCLHYFVLYLKDIINVLIIGSGTLFFTPTFFWLLVSGFSIKTHSHCRIPCQITGDVLIPVVTKYTPEYSRKKWYCWWRTESTVRCLFTDFASVCCVCVCTVCVCVSCLINTVSCIFPESCQPLMKVRDWLVQSYSWDPKELDLLGRNQT